MRNTLVTTCESLFLQPSFLLLLPKKRVRNEPEMWIKRATHLEAIVERELFELQGTSSMPALSVWTDEEMLHSLKEPLSSEGPIIGYNH